MCQSLDNGQNSAGGIFNLRISGQSFTEQSCHNSRTNNDIDVKLGLVTKLSKRNTATSKKFDHEVISAICDSLSFFEFMANLEQFGNRSPDVKSVKKSHSH